jgi:hypothetical protein
MAGHVAADRGDLCFVPRFAFVGGTAYRVSVTDTDTVGETTIGVLVRARPAQVPTTEVVAIHPSAPDVPRNLLRFYVEFSAPMSEGEATRHVRLADQDGRTLTGALLAVEHELWDPARRRLTVLLDPARIKRGLLPHRQLGYPLRTGASFQLVVNEDFRDASGTALRAGAHRCFAVGTDERRRVDPRRWRTAVPETGTRDPVSVTFDRPLDRALLARCLHVFDAVGRGVRGAPAIGEHERSWRFVPEAPWSAGSHHVRVDPILEDLAGNSLARVFDRDLASPDGPDEDPPLYLAFRPV